MKTELEKSFDRLSPIQREAVEWQEGAALVLAGPGAGKTKVLTIRIARLLSESAARKFRVLALTFTTKAAAEMRERVEVLVPGFVEERTFIGTFHAFCTQVLRQHGSHLGIRPDFGILGQQDDQEALLAEAIENAIQAGKNFSSEDIQFLNLIRQMKSKLIVPEKVLPKVRDPHAQEVYQLYEDSLREQNLMDFEGLILETCRLLSKMPAVAARIRQSYPYWMIDEFQDTTPGQYWLLYYLSAGEFKNVFVVADDDQIIYQWAGASYRQIEKYRTEYKPELIQLVENHRCPPEIVALANQLVATNTQRSPEKKPTVPSRNTPIDAISFRTFNTDEEEQQALANEIYNLGPGSWGKIAILGRTRTLLEPILTSLKSRGVNAVLAQRRDNFISPQFVWWQACLDQALRPTNKRVFSMLVNSANRVTGLDLDPALLIAEAEAAGQSFFEHWAIVASSTKSEVAQKLGLLVQKLAQSRNEWKQITQQVIPILLETASAGDGSVSDADDDNRAWATAVKEIRGELGHDPDLADLVQGIALRSKEPPREPNTVALMTVHASKGLEFDTVYVVGLAEGEMPSWQSCKKGDDSAEMEEERRNCFVAITRTQEKLILSTAKNYRKWDRKPSRFLKEMSFIV
jgi:DNA helicase-2/ATP-dependent DNA helicase PcrA